MLKWGILGAAKIAEFRVIPSLSQSRSNQVVAIGSRKLADAQRLADLAPGARAYDSYDAVLADNDVDAVYIPLPNGLHAEWTIKAAESGKHVLCEKAFAANADDAERMVEAATKAGTLLSEAFMYRFHPLTERIVRIVQSGKIGDLRSINTSFTFMLRDQNDIRRNSALAGGALLDIGTYCVSLARLLANAEPSEVNARGMFGPSGTDELVTGNLWFPNGIVASFLCSFNMPRSNPLMLVGTKGIVYVPWMFTYFDDNVVRTTPENDSTPHPTETVEHIYHEDPYLRMLDDFATAVAEKGAPKVTAQESLAHQRVLDALLSAARGDCV